ncbi:MAG: peptide-methionine (S)-S-oxide reductase MsrA [Pseudomonadota bacterium]
MRLTHPLTIAIAAGSLAAAATFLLNAGAQNGPEIQTATGTETAIFAGGCFWCVESDFDKLDGVLETVSGYTGGTTTDPTYASHTRDGHLEALRITYDPETVSYETLVEYFVRHIDPTDAGGQFCDRGNSYTTAVFVDTPAERDLVEEEFRKISAENRLTGPIVTVIRPEVAFYEAEKYHQDYYKKNPARYNIYRRGCGRDAQIKKVWKGNTD